MNVAANRMPIVESLNLKNSWILSSRISISNIQTTVGNARYSGYDSGFVFGGWLQEPTNPLKPSGKYTSQLS
jgi:hypothetical protein